MNDGGRRYRPVSGLRHQAKFDDGTLIRLCWGFGQGISIRAMAGSQGLSAKTVRAVYLDLRQRLKQPAFRRWHGLHRALIHHVEPETDALIRTAFIDVLAGCYGNDTCYRVFRRGNRETRLCAACPIPRAFSTAQNAQDAVELVDQVRGLYTRLGIREPDADPLQRFRERLIHGAVVYGVHANSRRLPNGLLDPSDMGYLAIGTLMDLLLSDLAAERDDRVVGTDSDKSPRARKRTRRHPGGGGGGTES